jgi:hypothetical protein
MIDLQKEAEEYVNSKWDWPEDVNGYECYTTGATSNGAKEYWLNSSEFQSKILQAQIDVLEKAWILKPPVDELIYSLNQQLKDLQNENT